MNRHGGVQVAYAVCCAQTDELDAGTVVGVKFRDLDPEARPGTFCAPGTRLRYPALPSVYGANQPDASIARMAGVSVEAVHRSASGVGRIRSSTEEALLQVASTLNGKTSRQS